MRTIEMNEIEIISGGTETQCVAAFALVGGVAGASAGSAGTLGFGSWAGFEGGAFLGGLAGGLLCGMVYK